MGRAHDQDAQHQERKSRLLGNLEDPTVELVLGRGAVRVDFLL